MAIREQARRGIALAWFGCIFGCREPSASIEPRERPAARPAPALDGDDEALLASLLSEDPGDFHVARARIWRIGPARWSTEAPEFPARPSETLRGGALEQPLEVVIVDGEGPRVLLPLEALGDARAPRRPALRLLVHVAPSDLVPGLTRELAPTPWLTLAAGLPLTPSAGSDDHLRVRWADPACGFALELAINPDDFGPVYEPGPSGRPTDEPERDGPALRLAPGAQLYADALGREPIVQLDPEPPPEASRLRAAQRVRLLGAPGKRELQGVELRCRGVAITGYVAREAVVELPGRVAVVEPTSPTPSTCAGFGAETILVPEATPLYEPQIERAPSVVGVVTAEVELAAIARADGWWRGCAPSPWGDLIFDFRLR